jgi:F0F1-type ATP synthase delta subunit
MLFSFILKNNDKVATVNIIRELYYIHWFISSNYQIKYFIESRVVSLDVRKNLLLIIAKKNLEECSDYTLAFLSYLLREKLFNNLSYILHLFKYFLTDETNILLVEAVSRHTISNKLLAFYKGKIEESTGRDVEFIFKYVPSMLGGFKLRWHSGEIDASIRKRVDAIKEIITAKRKV